MRTASARGIKMFIKYNPKYPHIIVVPIVSNGAAVAAGSVTLSPGTNEISEDVWNSIKEHLASEIEDGTIKPFSVARNNSSNAQKVKTLKDVPATTAAKIIAECSSKETLRKWFKDNLSDELALLVIKRMRQLNMDIDEIESGDSLSLSDSDITVETDSKNGDGKNSDDKNGGKGRTSSDGKNSGKGKAGNKNEESNPDSDANGDSETPMFDDPNAKVD